MYPIVVLVLGILCTNTRILCFCILLIFKLVSLSLVCVCVCVFCLAAGYNYLQLCVIGSCVSSTGFLFPVWFVLSKVSLIDLYVWTFILSSVWPGFIIHLLKATKYMKSWLGLGVTPRFECWPTAMEKNSGGRASDDAFLFRETSKTFFSGSMMWCFFKTTTKKSPLVCHRSLLQAMEIFYFLF